MKKVVDSQKIQNSLINLKKELETKIKENQTDLVYKEMLLKINSCLFSEYPHNFSK